MKCYRGIGKSSSPQDFENEQKAKRKERKEKKRPKGNARKVKCQEKVKLRIQLIFEVFRRQFRRWKQYVAKDRPDSFEVVEEREEVERRWSVERSKSSLDLSHRILRFSPAGDLIQNIERRLKIGHEFSI